MIGIGSCRVMLVWVLAWIGSYPFHWFLGLDDLPLCCRRYRDKPCKKCGGHTFELIKEEHGIETLKCQWCGEVTIE